MKICFLLVSITIILGLSICGFAQNKKCDTYDKNVTYKILSDNITTQNSHTKIFLEIYISPKKITVDSMIKLVERIKTEYCEFDEISVAIYDVKKIEKIPDPPPQPLTAWSGTSPRGFYEYNKQENTGELSFSEKRKDKEVQVEILFDTNGYSVSETEESLAVNRK